MKRTSTVITLILAGGLAFVPTPATAASPSWKTVKTLKPGRWAGFDDVSVIGRNDAWAFSNAVVRRGKEDVLVPSAFHWNGRSWKAVALPKGLSGWVRSASGSSPNNVWATVSDTEGPGGGVRGVLRWNGKRWSLVRKFAGRPNSTLALGAKDVWVFGASGADSGSGTWHYNGRSWARTKLPGWVELHEATRQPKSRVIWASARDDYGTNKLWRFDGRKWSPVSLGGLVKKDDPAHNVTYWVNAPVVLSAKNAWTTVNRQQYAKGKYQTSSTLVRWDGKRWRKVSAHRGAHYVLGQDGRRGLWVEAYDGSRNVLKRRSATGKWSVYGAPKLNRGDSLTWSPFATWGTTVWAAGARATKTQYVSTPTLWRLAG